MSCTCMNNPCYKSCVKTYNSAAQAVAAAGTTLAIGSPVTNTGVSLTAGANAITVNTRGLYHFGADVVFTGATSTSATSDDSSTSTTSSASTNNVVTAQLYNGNSALPCNIAQVTVNGNATATLHVETDLYLTPCTNVTPVISVKVSGESGTATFVSMEAVKLA